MRIFLVIGLIVVSLWMPKVGAESVIGGGPIVDCESQKTLGYRYWVLFGVIEGCTEFLPISSTGHLLIAERLLLNDQTQFVKDQRGQEIYKTTNGKKEKYTFKEAFGHYFLVIQGGSILAVFMLYWRFFYRMWKGFWGRDKAGRILLRNVVLAFIPAAVVGLLLEGLIHQYLFSMKVVAWGLIVGAVVMVIAEGYRGKRADRGEITKLEELSWNKSLLIGWMQCLALWPGMSRSMTTIVGGYFVGLPRRQAAEFSFLLGAVTLVVAAGYELVKEYQYLCIAFNYKHLLVGIIVSFVMANLTIRWFIRYLQGHGLVLFAIYRILLGVVVLLYF